MTAGTDAGAPCEGTVAANDTTMSLSVEFCADTTKARVVVELSCFMFCGVETSRPSVIRAV